MSLKRTRNAEYEEDDSICIESQITEYKIADASLDDRLYGNSVVTAGWTSNQNYDPTGRGHLFAINPGSDINQRKGMRIQMVEVIVRGLIKKPTVTTAINPQLLPMTRVLLVQNLQTNGVQAAPGEVISSGSASGEGVILAFENINYIGKHKILDDKIIDMRENSMMGNDALTSFESTGYYIPFELSHKFKTPTFMHFQGSTGGNVIDVSKNSLHFMLAHNSTNFGCTVSYRARLIYYDL